LCHYLYSLHYLLHHYLCHYRLLRVAKVFLRRTYRFRRELALLLPTGGYEVGESFVAAAARQIRPALTIADRRRADDRLIGRLRRER
nr:hypothetical protein [Tanacetum cinerariifolium]